VLLNGRGFVATSIQQCRRRIASGCFAQNSNDQLSVVGSKNIKEHRLTD